MIYNKITRKNPKNIKNGWYNDSKIIPKIIWSSADEKSINSFEAPFWMVSVSKKRFANSGGYWLYNASVLIFGSRNPNSNEERMNIFCCKFSVIRNCIKDKMPTKATPAMTIKTKTIQEILTLPDWIRLIIAWMPNGSDKLIKPAKMA